MQILLKRVPERRNAVLHGFRRHRIQQQVFPAMIPGSSDDSVHGQVRPCGDWLQVQPTMHVTDARSQLLSLPQVLSGLTAAELDILVRAWASVLSLFAADTRLW